MKHIIYSILMMVLVLFLYSCSGTAPKTASSSKANQAQIHNNKVKVGIEQQKNKILELEQLVKELNNRIEIIILVIILVISAVFSLVQ